MDIRQRIVLGLLVVSVFIFLVTILVFVYALYSQGQAVPPILQPFLDYHMHFMVLMGVFGVFSGLVVYSIMNATIEKQKKVVKTNIGIIMKFLSPDEREIANLLLEKDGRSTQSEIARKQIKEDIESLTGVGQVIKPKKSTFKIVAVEPEGSPLLSEGKAGPHKIQGIGANFVPEVLDRELIDEIVKVTNDAGTAHGAVALEEGIPEDVMADLYYYRSIAYCETGNLAAAEADLKIMNDKRTQLSYRSGEAIHDLVWLRVGDFYRQYLKDDDRALTAYANVLARTTWAPWGQPRKPAATGGNETLAAATKAVSDILRKRGKDVFHTINE